MKFLLKNDIKKKEILSLGQACLLGTDGGTSFLVEVSDSPKRADPWAGTAPVAVSAVLARSQVVGPSLVVWLVVQQPVAVDHAARVNVGHP